MKTKLSLFAAAIMTLVAVSCDKTPEGQKEPEKPITTPTEYTITVSADTGGSAVAMVDGAEVTKAVEGTVVTLTATEDDGFKFVTWIAPAGVTLDDPTEKVVTFTMPSADVTFTREYRLALTPSYDEGVVINGVRWATRNVDAPGFFTAKIGDVGMFYQWDMKLGWSGNPDEPMTSSNGDTEWPEEYPYYDEDWITISTFWREENDPSPDGWRVPTIDELLLLCDEDNVSWTWEDATEAMPAGMRFTDKASGESIFMNADVGIASKCRRHWILLVCLSLGRRR